MRALASSTAATVLLLAAGCAEPPEPPTPLSQPGADDRTAVETTPERNAYFGDLHVHTMLSMDAYWMFGTRLGPEEAYRFARGDEVMFMGQSIRRRRPLDFMAVTDHGVLLGSGLAMEDPASALATSAIGREFLAGPRRSAWGGAGLRAIGALTAGDVPGFDIASLSRSAWDRIVDAANGFYEPGDFTTFIAYEWTTDNTTSDGAGGPIHRNVIFRGDTAPLPFSSRDSQRPEDLWSYLEQHRDRGVEGLIIPHNGNTSNGAMYAWTDSDGRPIDEAYARRRLLNEPISEIAQMKGQSEVHPALAPNDEFASFELFDVTFDGRRSEPAGSTIRDAYGRGLVIGERAGANPYKMGVIGGWDYAAGLPDQPNWVRAAYAGGAPMGGDLPARPAGGSAPRFILHAVKDPDGANLDRAQIVKVWRDGDGYKDQVYDVALSDGRAADPTTGEVPAVGNTVDLSSATYTNSIGATQLSAVWDDPAFDPAIPAVYYLRVLEIPTPRWPLFVAVKLGRPHPFDHPPTIQERAWSSAIWYVPPE